jgi:hypothetical protein
MDEEVAKLVIGAGFAVGAIVWMIVVQLYRRMADAPHVERLETPANGKSPAEAMRAVVEASRQLAAQARLARPTDESFQVSQFGVDAHIFPERRGGQMVLVAELDDSRLRRRMQFILAAFVLLVMPAAVVGIPAALFHYVAANPAGAVRWQSLQVMQMVHFLWPPFLVYFLWKKQRAMVADAISNLLVLADAA